MRLSIGLPNKSVRYLLGGEPHPSAIQIEKWDRSGDDLHVKTRFKVRNVAGVYLFRCQPEGWKLVKDTVHEYKPLPQ